MEIETPIRTSFMGITAINVGGLTLNGFLHVSVGIREYIGTSKQVKPQGPTKLQAFKQQYNIDNLLVLIIY